MRFTKWDFGLAMAILAAELFLLFVLAFGTTADAIVYANTTVYDVPKGFDQVALPSVAGLGSGSYYRTHTSQLSDRVQAELRDFELDPDNRVVTEQFLVGFGIDKDQEALYDWQRELLTQSVLANAAQMALLDHDNELWTAEMDLELDQLEQACEEQEKDLALRRDLATQLYTIGGPLEFIPDPTCRRLPMPCERMPACVRRWDCQCAKDTIRPLYPSTREALQSQLDYSRHLNGRLKQVKTICEPCTFCKEGVRCRQDPQELERVRRQFDHEWKKIKA